MFNNLPLRDMTGIDNITNTSGTMYAKQQRYYPYIIFAHPTHKLESFIFLSENYVHDPFDYITINFEQYDTIVYFFKSKSHAALFKLWLPDTPKPVYTDLYKLTNTKSLNEIRNDLEETIHNIISHGKTGLLHNKNTYDVIKYHIDEVMREYKSRRIVNDYSVNMYEDYARMRTIGRISMRLNNIMEYYSIDIVLS